MTKPYLKLDSNSLNIKAGEVFAVDLVLESSNNPVTAIDAVINFDSSKINILNYNSPDIKKTDLFTTVGAKLTNSQEIYVYAINRDSPIVKSGKVATIYFQASKAGSAQFNISCKDGLNSSQIITSNDNLSNIIDCNKTTENTVTATVTETQNVLGVADSKQNVSIWAIFMLIVFGGILLTLLMYRYKKFIQKIIKK